MTPPQHAPWPWPRSSGGWPPPPRPSPRLVALVPDVVVGDERERRVAELGLARQLGLGHVGHADHVDAPAPVDPGLGLGRELRALDAEVRAAPVDGRPGLGGGRVRRRAARSGQTGRPSPTCATIPSPKNDETRRFVWSKNWSGTTRSSGRDRLAHAAHRADGDHPLDAERASARRCSPGSGSSEGVSRWPRPWRGQEHDLAVAEAADAVGVGRIAERRPHPLPADVGEPLQLVEPAASDDADSRPQAIADERSVPGAGQPGPRRTPGRKPVASARSAIQRDPARRNGQPRGSCR